MSRPGERPPIKVLLVDDDEDDYLITKEVLEDCEVATYELTWSADITDAQQQIARGDFDICLADYHLGSHTGLELLEALGELPITRRPPVILLTGLGRRELDLRAMKVGAADYLVKGDLGSSMLERSIRYAIDRHQAQSELERVARYDQLTELPNRASFRERLSAALHRARRSKRPVALLFVDLDDFKPVNDTLGHDAGDALLRAAAKRMSDSVRVVDAVSRLGGDEFTVILEDVPDPKDVVVVAERIRATLHDAFTLRGRQVQLSCSIGIALFPEDGQTSDMLLMHADAAMYEAKQSGRNAYQFFSSEIMTAATRKQNLHAALRSALANNEFRLHYQPQFDVTGHQVVGVEALLRWQRGDRLVPPFEFIPLLEEGGLIVPVGAWVLQQACRDLKTWLDAGSAELNLAVNISPRQLRDPTLAHVVGQALAAAGLPPNVLELEITESILVEDASAEPTLREVARMGVRVSIDDFGTGYSSLAYLKKFPVTGIKVDRSFVKDFPDEDDGRLASAIIALGHSLGLTVVAEGVETVEQLDFLRERGADVIQGFLFSRPIPAEDCQRLLTQDLRKAS